MTPWFGPKSRYGIGIASWQGAVAVLLFVAFAVGLRWFHPEDLGWPDWSRRAVSVAGIVAFLSLIRAKYDRNPD